MRTFGSNANLNESFTLIHHFCRCLILKKFFKQFSTKLGTHSYGFNVLNVLRMGKRWT